MATCAGCHTVVAHGHWSPICEHVVCIGCQTVCPGFCPGCQQIFVAVKEIKSDLPHFTCGCCNVAYSVLQPDKCPHSILAVLNLPVRYVETPLGTVDTHTETVDGKAIVPTLLAADPHTAVKSVSLQQPAVVEGPGVYYLASPWFLARLEIRHGDPAVLTVICSLQNTNLLFKTDKNVDVKAVLTRGQFNGMPMVFAVEFPLRVVQPPPPPLDASVCQIRCAAVRLNGCWEVMNRIPGASLLTPHTDIYPHSCRMLTPIHVPYLGQPAHTPINLRCASCFLECATSETLNAHCMRADEQHNPHFFKLPAACLPAPGLGAQETPNPPVAPMIEGAVSLLNGVCAHFAQYKGALPDDRLELAQVVLGKTLSYGANLVIVTTSSIYIQFNTPALTEAAPDQLRLPPDLVLQKRSPNRTVLHFLNIFGALRHEAKPAHAGILVPSAQTTSLTLRATLTTTPVTVQMLKVSPILLMLYLTTVRPPIAEMSSVMFPVWQM